MTSVLRRVFAAGAPYLRKARQALDLPLVGDSLEEYSRAHRVLLLARQAFDFPHQPPPKTLFTGPIIDDPSWADAADPVLRELETVDKKIVLVTLGSTFQDQKEVYRRIIKGLAAGVPLLCMPLGRDQLDNAARVTWHGAGLSIKANATPERIAAALAKVLATPAMKTSAQRLGAAIQQEIARNLAVSELEAAAAQGTH